MINTEHPYYEEVKSLLERLVAGGATLDYVDTGYRLVAVSTLEYTLEAILSVDECTLEIQPPGYNTYQEHLYIILGNDPGELVSGYTVSEFLDRITEEHSEYWSTPLPPDQPPGAWYVSTCPDTQRVFVCQMGVDNNICEVFSRGPSETVGDNAWLIADALNLTLRLSP